MSVRSDFCEIVGLDKDEDTTPLRPSQAIRMLWSRLADTYDVHALRPLWSYNVKVLMAHRAKVGPPRPVMRAWWDCMVEVAAFSGKPAPQPLAVRMQPEVDAIECPHWTRIQRAVETLAVAWEEIGL